ncbi:DUF4406 domain-containing protein [Campylobacter concisus]|uniref:DUF7768 domain-containing protein n=1 Tax=Campylobacter concisus TaxID=199 RepID=UPI00112F9792|nr:DUF4406 domain-containing protein [Campylobacter concisus]
MASRARRDEFANETDALSDAVRQAKSQRSYAKPDKQAKRKEKSLKETMRLVYVASPYAAFKSGKVNADFMACMVARDECRKVKEAGYIPLSPVLAFSGVFSEEQRDEVLKAGLEMLGHCSYVYFSKHPASEFSKGMDIEREYARELGISELEI